MASALADLSFMLEMSRKMQERLDQLKGAQGETVRNLQRSVANCSDSSLSWLLGEGGVS